MQRALLDIDFMMLVEEVTHSKFLIIGTFQGQNFHVR